MKYAAAAIALALGFVALPAQGQEVIVASPTVTYYAPSVPVTTYYAPTTAYYYSPAVPVTTYYAPAYTYYPAYTYGYVTPRQARRLWRNGYWW